MFGTKLRSWMEAHIVRSRKKQQRSKETKSNVQKDPPPNPPHDSKNEECRIARERSEGGEREGGTMSEAPTLHNLSSPESAYSTGYSTDGTSPGASIPPEYYINLRTGKHYVHTTTGNTTSTQGPGPASPYRKRKPKTQDGLPESSTEEDIAERPSKPPPPHKVPTPKTQRKLNPFLNVNSNFHRRTESCDESQQRLGLPMGSERDSEGSSSTQTGTSLPCQSPYLSTASPRQRNRIRTNPWLGANQQERNRNYTSQGETSSTVGSSSTLSSSGCKERIPREESRLSFSPKPHNKKLEDIKNFNVFRSSTFTTSPLVGARKPLGTVTTCSPLPNRPCRHFRPGTSSSSSSSAPSSGSDDNHHGNTSDFSDDDVTLNEMLGKYDESYVYEKETDILSDSDPTDCEEQNDYNDNSSHLAEEQQGGSDLDFIDNGSLLELANSDSECSGKLVNKGHCTYHNTPGHTPDTCRRQCSRIRRTPVGDGSAASSRGSSINNKRFRRASSRRSEEISASADVLPKRFSSRKKLRQSSRERKRSAENVSKEFPRSAQLKNKHVPINDSDARPFDQNRAVNLNRVLMERLIHNQRSGTRSADGTPVSLRRNGTHDYNGKYLRNPHVSKLINSNSNLMEKKTVIDEGNEKKVATTILKKRSNSLSGYSASNPPALPPRNPIQNRSEKAPVDKEGDMKYRQLIQEAETILEGYKGPPKRQEFLSPTLSTRSAILPNTSKSPVPQQYNIYENDCDMNSQLSMLEEKINNNPIPKTDNEEGIFKAISKTLEKIIIRGSEKKTEKNESGKNKKKYLNAMMFSTAPSDDNNSHFTNQMNANLRHSSEFLTSTDKNDNMFPACYTPTRFRVHNKSEVMQTFQKTKFVGNIQNYEVERFRPVNKGVDIIRGTEPIYSPLSMSPKRMHVNNMHGMKQRGSKTWQENNNEPFVESNYVKKNPTQTENCTNGAAPEPPLIPFKSFDLGNQIAVSSRYCPQSEPVKRKVYVGSSSFGKLQKSLMRKKPEKNYPSSDMTTEDLRV